jgi:predicted cupin superfamily sugar epimerase
MERSAEYWINNLELKDHPEGGAFAETYRGSLKISRQNLPGNFKGERNICTGIYYLLQKNQFSAFHRLCSDELWHFYTGDPLTIYEIDVLTGKLMVHTLGSDFDARQTFQAVIKAGNWFASRICGEGTYALVGCTVAPGFDFAEFEVAERKKLTEQYPLHKDLIASLTS